MATDGWTPEPRPVPPELITGFKDHSVYRDPFLVPVLEKLDNASLKQLAALMGAWPIAEDA